MDACRAMNALGINQGTSGNISVRHGRSMLISPSAVPYDEMSADQIVALTMDGDGAWSGPAAPSTEWRMHLEILLRRPEAGAVVHGHPPFATALAIARREIPACHYMIAAFGGPTIRCAPYATFGTSELARHALTALAGRNACLLANHGVIVCGPTLARAMWLAAELETLARQYYHSLLIGGPVILSDAAVAATAEKLGSYGLREDTGAAGNSDTGPSEATRSAASTTRRERTTRKPPTRAGPGASVAARRAFPSKESR